MERLAACQELLANGLVGRAEAVLETLRTAHVQTPEVKRLIDYCRYMRRVLGQSSVTDMHGNPVLSDAAEERILLGHAFDDVFARAREGSSKLLVVFTGAALRFGVSLSVLLRVLDRFDCSLVFLKDVSARFYAHGVKGLGGTYRGTLDGLFQLADQLGASELYCMGQSAGGFASVQYGLDLGARGVLAFVPATCLDPLLEDGRLDLPKCAVPGVDCYPRPFDLRSQLLSARCRPSVKLVFGEAAEPDASQARRLDGLEGVHLDAVAGYATHDVFHQIVADERLEPMLKSLLLARRVQ